MGRGHAVLIVEDDPTEAANVVAAVRSRGDAPYVVATVEEALLALEARQYCYCLVDQQLPTDASDMSADAGGRRVRHGRDPRERRPAQRAEVPRHADPRRHRVYDARGLHREDVRAGVRRVPQQAAQGEGGGAARSGAGDDAAGGEGGAWRVCGAESGGGAVEGAGGGGGCGGRGGCGDRDRGGSRWRRRRWS